ncbi:MAG: DUF2141 domain-containing protein [alpha proteobacterium HIMB59]|jgi:uncharacterized protein (DUF2141 family)|nr:MAG: DUF2141 domain-containing protein [alpha proteobacterium HIMB59]|tara:strand:- start:6601 stop:7083 length:483 start_codon:yes stop_codon:yes gene_type:complete
MQLSKKNINLLEVMHSYMAVSKKVLFFVIFQLFLFINPSYSDHLTVKVSGFQNATSPIYVWGYDRKFYFEEESAPLFMVGERDINNFNRINLKAFPHMVMGLFVYQDLDDNGVFSKDFKGDPLEPYGFSLNPAQDYQEVVFEDIAFDMNKFDEIEISLKN